MNAEQWSSFFVAAAGAGAALAGLIIVATSVNVKTILAIPSMTSRAATTIATLTLLVVISCEGLFPGQPLTALGIEITCSSLLVLFLSLRSAAIIFVNRGDRSRADALLKGLLGVLPTTVAITGGAALIAAQPAGFYLVGASLLLFIAGSVTNAWVLLVEILR